MSLYPLLVFLHVLGAVMIFGGWTIEAIVLTQLTRARGVDDVRTSLALRRGAMHLAPPGMVTVLVTGVWMMLDRWGHQAWMAAAVAAIAGMMVVGIPIGRRVGRHLGRAMSSESGSAVAQVAEALPLLGFWLRLRVALGIGILGLMTVKPAAAGSVLIIGAALLAGVAATVVAGRRRVPAVS